MVSFFCIIKLISFARISHFTKIILFDFYERHTRGKILHDQYKMYVKIFFWSSKSSNSPYLILLSSGLKNWQKKATAKNVNKTFTKKVSLMWHKTFYLGSCCKIIYLNWFLKKLLLTNDLYCTRTKWHKMDKRFNWRSFIIYDVPQSK